MTTRGLMGVPFSRPDAEKNTFGRAMVDAGDVTYWEVVGEENPKGLRYVREDKTGWDIPYDSESPSLGSCGIMWQSATVRFFCAEDIEEDIETWKVGGVAENHAGYLPDCLGLPLSTAGYRFTTNKPVWWDNAYVKEEPEGHRGFMIDWDCCGHKRTSAFFWIGD